MNGRSVPLKSRRQAALKGWKTRRARETEYERRSRAAKKGWVTRRRRIREQKRYEREERRAIAEETREWEEVKRALGPEVEDIGRTERQVAAHDVAKLEAARLLLDAQLEAARRKLKRPERLLSKEERLRVKLAQAKSYAELESAIYDVAAEGEYSAHELFSLFFSPEVA